MPYITSTMSASVTYAVYKKTAGGLSVVDKEITINGGANVMNKKLLATPNGVVTEVSDAELELLENHPLFKLHKANGFITISKARVSTDENLHVETAKNMEKKDASSQRVDSDYTKKGKKAPKVVK